MKKHKTTSRSKKQKKISIPRPLFLMPLLMVAIIAGWWAYANLEMPKPFDRVPAGQNLLANPDFEQWKDPQTIEGWSTMVEPGGVATVTQSEGVVNGKALRVDANQALPQSISVDSPEVAVRPNQTYFFKSFYRTDTTLQLIVEYTYNNGTTKNLTLESFPDYDYPWSSMSHTFTTDANVTSARMRIVISTPGYLELDSAYVIEASPEHDKAPMSTDLLAGTTPEHKQYDDGRSAWMSPTIPVTPHELYRFTVPYQSSQEAEIGIDVTYQNGSYGYKILETTKPTPFAITREVDIEIPADVIAIAPSVQVASSSGTLKVAPGSLYKLASAQQFSEPRVSITFDDGWLSSYTNGARILDKYDMHATYYITPAYTGKPAYMKESDIRALQEKGHQIGSHAYSHFDLSAINDATATRELDSANEVLRKKYRLNDIDFAAPYGKIDKRILDITRQSQRSQRGTKEGINTKQNYDIYNLRAFFVDKGRGDADLKARLDAARESNGWLILVYHNIEPSDSMFATEIDEFDRQMKLIRESGIRVDTVEDALLFYASR